MRTELETEFGLEDKKTGQSGNSETTQESKPTTGTSEEPSEVPSEAQI